MSYLLKFLVAGESGVGKTTLIRRYIANKFLTGVRGTIGVDFFLKNMKAEDIDGLDKDEELQVQIWDMSGEDRFREILPLYTPGTQGVLLCFDTESALTKLWKWEIVLSGLIPVSVPRTLVRTKFDLDNDIPMDQIKKFLKEHENVDFVETSSKNGQNVEEAFMELAAKAFSPLKQL